MSKFVRHFKALCRKVPLFRKWDVINRRIQIDRTPEAAPDLALIPDLGPWDDSPVVFDTLSADANQALAMAEFAAGVTKVRSTPPSLSLESTSRCNLRCVMCNHAIGAVDRPKHLDAGLVEKLRFFLKRARSVQLHGIGEPTNSPAFWDLLTGLPEPQLCNSSVNSNFTVMDDGRIQKLLESNLRVVNVSLDAGTAATYQKIRGFSFEVVINNIELFMAERRARGQTYPLLFLNMTMMRSNIEELGDFIRLAKRLGADQTLLWHLNHWDDGEMARYVIERDGWVFDYAKEGLWNFPALSNGKIRQAIELARELDVRLDLGQNTENFFDEIDSAA